MKFVSYNIQYGFGADGRYDLGSRGGRYRRRRRDRVAGSRAQLAAHRQRRSARTAVTAAATSLLRSTAPPSTWMRAASELDGKVVNRRRQFGTMLLSRFPILWSRLHLLPMRKVVRPLNTQNAALEGLIRTPAGPVRIFSIHLSHIGVEERLEQIAFLKALHRRVPFEGGPWSGVDDEPERDWAHGEGEPEAPLAAIWMGDFNCEPGSDEYLAITGRNPSPSDRCLSRRLRRCRGGGQAPPLRPAIRMCGCIRARSRSAGSTIVSSAPCLPNACARSASIRIASPPTISRSRSTSTWKRRRTWLSAR